MFGSHLSIAGGLENALIEASKLGMQCVQIFTKNQRTWKTPALTSKQIDTWRTHQSETGIKIAVSHDSYLINLASPQRTTHDRSTRLFREELRRCELLQIPYLVAHPGAHMGHGIDKGLQRVAQTLNHLHDEEPDLKVLTCLEITAGQGTSLGFELEQLAVLIDLVKADQRLGVCLDTAHLLASGYDLTSKQGAATVLRHINRTVGLKRVKVLHLNDSKIERGKRVDRHEHIGHGYVSLQAFGVFVNEPQFKRLPKILETPKGVAPNGRPWDTLNLQKLKALVRTKP